jgi:ABC-type bacteriocin/lantibiotic exporter with double-glycine peptidase domain
LNSVKIARVEEFTENLPEKLNTNIGENGIKLSGGQRQRIAIARAIAQKKEVILLDEPTSNLDLKTESELFKNLSKIKNMTLIVVAHRLSTIKNFNEIYFIENGKVLEKGAHKSLIFKKGHYFRLYQKQLRKNA